MRGSPQLLLDSGHRHDALMGILKMPPRLLRLHGARLEQEDTGDDLQAVGDAVPHLLEQHLLLAQQIVLLAFGGASPGDILHRQQQRGARIGLVEHLTRIEQQCAATDGREVVLDLVTLDDAVLGDDLFEKFAQRRDAPLAVGQLVEQAALRLAGRDRERLVERTAGSNYPEISVEHHQGLVNRVNDGIRQRASLPDLIVRNAFEHCPFTHESRSLASKLWTMVSAALRPRRKASE